MPEYLTKNEQYKLNKKLRLAVIKDNNYTCSICEDKSSKQNRIGFYVNGNIILCSICFKNK